MRHWILLASFLAVLAFVSAAPPAAAKGPSEAEVTWEGQAVPIRLGLGRGGPPGVDRLGRDTGLMAAMWRETPDPLLDAAPTDDLGSPVTISWTVPGPLPAADTIVQTVYPYAAGGPLVFTEPGQPFFGTEHTVGGWLRAPARLTTTLQDLGAPSRPAPPSDGGFPVPWVAIGATLGGIALALTAARTVVRRRVTPAAAAT
jgi:hypothetical protein